MVKRNMSLSPSLDQNPQKIRLQYSGASKVYLNGEQLVIQTTLGNVIEDAPFAYQTIGDKRVEVDCHYVLKDSTLRYKLGKIQ